MSDEPVELEGVIGDLWRFYEEHAAQARQHENLRATVTSILAAFAAALVGLASVDGLDRDDGAAAALVIVIGLLGAPISLKHYERNRFHTKVMGTVRDEIALTRANPDHSPASPGDLRERAEKKHNEKFSLRGEKKTAHWLVRVHLWWFWLALPLAIAAVGVVLLIVSLRGDG